MGAQEQIDRLRSLLWEQQCFAYRLMTTLYCDPDHRKIIEDREKTASILYTHNYLQQRLESEEF